MHNIHNSHTSLTLQMLAWIQQQPHCYAEVLEVWRTTCPRLSIWEDACADGLIQCGQGRNGLVSITARGEQMLREAASSPRH